LEIVKNPMDASASHLPGLPFCVSSQLPTVVVLRHKVEEIYDKPLGVEEEIASHLLGIRIVA
jgi:hypothetical protein